MDSLHHSWVSIIAMKRQQQPQLRTELIVPNFRSPRNKPLRVQELVEALDTVPGLKQQRRQRSKRSSSAPPGIRPSAQAFPPTSPLKSAMNQFSAETKFTSSRTDRSGPAETGEHYFRSLRNPQDPLGGGIPDQTIAPLERIVVKSEYIMTTGAGGDWCGIFYPGCNSSTDVLVNASSNGVWTEAGGGLFNIDNYTAVDTIFDEYRPVSMKVYVAPTQALTAATGEITMGTMNVPSGGIVGATPSVTRTGFSDRESRLFASMSGRQYALWSPEDASESNLQVVTQAALGSGGQPSGRNGQCIVVLLQGGSGSATVGHVCVETCFELTPESTYAFLGRATRHRCDPLGQAQALNAHYALGPLVGF